MKKTLLLTMAMSGMLHSSCKTAKDNELESSHIKGTQNQPLVNAAIATCSNKPGSAERTKALQAIHAYKFGSRDIPSASLITSKEACVTGVLPAAIYTSIRSGVPVSSLVAQAIQETGYCKSVLAQSHNNFHGQKAKFDKKNFQYWDGAAVDISSSESTTGSGNNVVSSFMKFKHVDFSFYAVAERQTMKGLPYRECAKFRTNTTQYIDCFAKSWAVHATYGEHLKKHIATFAFNGTSLAKCDLKKEEWKLDDKFKDLP